MNKSEQIAKEYLQKKHKEIVFRSRKTPDFTTESQEYEVKKIYGSQLIFYDTQIEKIKEDTVILAVNEIAVEKEFLWKDRDKQPYKIHIEDTAKKGRIVRIDRKTYNKIMQYDDNFSVALKKALNLTEPNQESEPNISEVKKEEIIQKLEEHIKRKIKEEDEKLRRRMEILIETKIEQYIQQARRY